jgi:hypothetical protein
MFSKQISIRIYSFLFAATTFVNGSTLEEQTYLGTQEQALPAVTVAQTNATKLPLMADKDAPQDVAPPIQSQTNTATLSLTLSKSSSLPVPSFTPTASVVPTSTSTMPNVCSQKSKSLALPTAWAERDDVINTEADFQALLAKAKVSGALPIKNNTPSSISIHIRGQQRVKEHIEPVELDLTIAAGQTLNILSLASYDSINLNTGSQGFLNFYSTKSKFKVAVEQEPVLLFPRTLSPFAFVPDKEAACLVGTTKDEQAKIEQYWGHVGFMKYVVCRDEKIDPVDFYLQRLRLYEAFKLEAIVEKPLPYIPRIPLNLFSIWLTNLSTPKEPDQELVDLALASSRINRRKDGWNHYFLVQDPNLFPQTAKALAGSDIRLVSFTQLLGTLDLESELAESIAERKFGMASDILRVEALKKMGGGYLDIDLQALHSLKLYFHAYHSLFAIEPMSEFIGNAFMAAARNHPIMQEMVRLIKRNFELKRAQNKSFYSSAASDGFSTIVQTGPCVSTVAFYNAANREGRVDILMPPEAFYPAKSLKRPEFGIPTLRDAFNLRSATLHLWLTTWAGARGARNGSCG